jgi:hypothetical protein
MCGLVKIETPVSRRPRTSTIPLRQCSKKYYLPVGDSHSESVKGISFECSRFQMVG